MQPAGFARLASSFARVNQLTLVSVLSRAAKSYVALTHHFLQHPRADDPHPIALLMADNTTAESWIIRACTSSAIGRALGRVQCAPMINNPLGINCGHVCSEDNEVADRISCLLNETN